VGGELVRHAGECTPLRRCRQACFAVSRNLTFALTDVVVSLKRQLVITRQQLIGFVVGLVIGILSTSLIFVAIGRDTYVLYHTDSRNVMRLNKRTGQAWVFTEQGWLELGERNPSSK